MRVPSVLRPTTMVLCLLAASFFLLGPSGVATSAEEPTADIVETAIAAGTFSTLVAALQAADLVDVLRTQDSLTVFAPTDAAFEQLPEGTVTDLLRPENRDQLVKVLSYHVVAGERTAAVALAAGSLETLTGDDVTVALEEGRLRVGDATVIQNDLRTRNGTIHVIDRVLLPPTPETPADSGNAGAAVEELFALAIERGVPLFNHGQAGACAAVYEVAVRSVVDRPAGLPASAVAVLRETLRSASRDHDAVSVAWTLRGGIDRTLQILETERLRAEVRSMPSTTIRLFDFDDPSTVSQWFSLNDDVMGGISTSRLVSTEEGTARFEGALSLENNGGFATVRSRARDLSLDSMDALRFRVRGDGRVYRISVLASDGRGVSRTWMREFTTREGRWQELTVPFSELVLNIRGRRFPEAGPPERASIRSISFGIADKDESPYSLEIDRIEAVRGLPAEAASTDDPSDGSTRRSS